MQVECEFSAAKAGTLTVKLDNSNGWARAVFLFFLPLIQFVCELGGLLAVWCCFVTGSTLQSLREAGLCFTFHHFVA